MRASGKRKINIKRHETLGGIMTNRFLILGAVAALLGAASPGYAQVTGVNTPPGSNQPLYLGTNGDVNMAIDTNGEVGIGIGTASANQMLEINGANPSNINLGGIQIDDRGDGCCAQLTMTDGGARWDTYATAAGSYYIYQVKHPGGSPGLGQWLTILDAGNVGIGTVSPQAPLDVNGGVRGSNGATIVAGASCSPEGMLAYDLTNHQPVYCNQSGIWTDVNATNAFLNRTWHVSGTSGTNTYDYPIEILSWCLGGNGAFMENAYVADTQFFYCEGTHGYQDFCSAEITVPPGQTWSWTTVNCTAHNYVLY